MIECSNASVHFISQISCFGGTPLVILVDLLNGSIGVERVVLFLTVGDLSGALDVVYGRDAIVGIGDSFPSTVGVNWKVWFSSIWVLESICVSLHSVVFKCGLM